MTFAATTFSKCLVAGLSLALLAGCGPPKLSGRYKITFENGGGEHQAKFQENGQAKFEIQDGKFKRIYTGTCFLKDNSTMFLNMGCGDVEPVEIVTEQELADKEKEMRYANWRLVGDYVYAAEPGGFRINQLPRGLQMHFKAL